MIFVTPYNITVTDIGCLCSSCEAEASGKDVIQISICSKGAIEKVSMSTSLGNRATLHTLHNQRTVKYLNASKKIVNIRASLS